LTIIGNETGGFKTIQITTALIVRSDIATPGTLSA
jgi:hypothetical protein